jgi:murein DD-endopeptidase MepM/ murein hydrolase activator NlpD
MSHLASRRAILRGSIAAALSARIRPVSAQSKEPAFSIPIGLPGRTLGDGFFIGHGYACENTWYNPRWLHTGEDWYMPGRNTAGASVYAVAGGEVVFAGSDYPGRVVIVRHADDLYSMYGHLDYGLAVTTGATVTRGQLLGTVLDRTDGRAPSHLHFELRTFLTTPEVNGDAPRYGYGCGFNCPPGPGYWPIDAPEHPSAMGWRNPTHVIARHAFPDGPSADTEVVVASGAGETSELWSEPSDHVDAKLVGELPLNAGDRYRLLSVATGREASRETSAEGYRLWYRIVVPDVGRVWVQAARPSAHDTGADGRPSSVRFDFLPARTGD